MVVVLADHGVTESEIVVVAHVRHGQVATDVVGKVRRQTGQEIVVAGVDYPILVAQVTGEGHAHPRVQEATEDSVDVFFQRGGRRLRVVVHHRGLPRLQHVQRGVQGHQVVIVGTAAPTGQNPHFEAVVAGAHLQGGDAAAVVVGVDQAGDDRVRSDRPSSASG